MDLQTISWNLRKHEYAESCKNTLCIISNGFNTISRQDLVFLANEFILSLEFKKENDKWTKKQNATAIRDLQCVEILIFHFETEKDLNIRMFTFDLLFGDLYNNNLIKNIISLLLSCAVSLESTHTLECFSKWILNNIGNEIVQIMFDRFIKDHILLMIDLKSLENLPSKSTLFCSLFINVLLDRLQNSTDTKLIRKSLNLFINWFKKYPLLAIQALKENINHLCSHMLNPLPGILYLNVVHASKDQSNDDSQHDLLHLNTIRLLKELSNTKLDQFKVLDLKNIEFILKNAQVSRDDCMRRLSQVLQICMAKDLVSFTRDDLKQFKLKNF